MYLVRRISVNPGPTIQMRCWGPNPFPKIGCAWKPPHPQLFSYLQRRKLACADVQARPKWNGVDFGSRANRYSSLTCQIPSRIVEYIISTIEGIFSDDPRFSHFWSQRILTATYPCVCYAATTSFENQIQHLLRIGRNDDPLAPRYGQI